MKSIVCLKKGKLLILTVTLVTLSRHLTETGLEWARGKQEGVFLFSNDEALPFYEKCGFRPIEEYLVTVEAPRVKPSGGAVKLDPRKRRDLAKIHRYAEQRPQPPSMVWKLRRSVLSLSFHLLPVAVCRTSGAVACADAALWCGSEPPG